MTTTILPGAVTPPEVPGGYRQTHDEAEPTGRVAPTGGAVPTHDGTTDSRAGTGAALAWTAIGPADAPAIVFVHGTRLTRRQWWPQLRRLGATYRCIAVDLPGHGTQAAVPFTIDGAVDTIRRAIQAESASGTAVIVGLSLGGYVAIDAACAHPEVVAGLVLAGCTGEPIGPMTAPFRFFRFLLRRPATTLQDLVNVTFFRVRYRRTISEPIIEGGFWGQGGAAGLDAVIDRPYLDRLSRLWTPVLVINGALDPVFGPQGDYWAASCRQGRQAVLPRAMHLSNLDRPSAFSRLVGSFAGRISRDG
jgi:pimeloyl-ACP methyl ester carboxylesterase